MIERRPLSPEIIRSPEEILREFGGAIIRLRQQEKAETGV